MKISGSRFYHILFLCFVFLLLTEGKLQAQPVIYLEWIKSPQNSVVINWIDDNSSNRSISLRKRSADTWQNISAVRNPIPGSDLYRYKADAEGLEPGSVYEFKVSDDPGIHSFKTAPLNIDEPMQFIVAGDIYTDVEGSLKSETVDAFLQMASNASEFEPYFAALGGDLAHSGSDPTAVSLWFEFLELWQESMQTEQGHMVPMVITIGNNEVPGGYGAEPEDLIFINALFSFPKDQWGNSSFNHYGVLDFGDYMSLIMLNTNHSNQIEGEQTTWLRNTLNNRSNSAHVYPVYHVAGWPAFRTFRGIHEDAVRNNWHRLFRAFGVRTVFEHHDHIFKKTEALGDCRVPITSVQDCELANKGVIYVGGGSWGSPNNRDFNNEWYIDEYSNDHNFMLVEISEAYRKFSAIGENGQTITSFIDYLKLPPPDDILAENITTTSFKLRWDRVVGATRYFLDVSRDENFQNFVDGFKNRNVGLNRSLSVSGLDPNRRYYFRIRAESLFDIGEYSETFEITLEPEAPVALNASDLRVTSFSANWNSVPNVSEYLISISRDSLFTSIVPGFDQKRIENETSVFVENLEPDTNYYYKVKALFPPQESEFSNTVTVKTIGLDDQLSETSVDINKVLANSDQKATLTVRLIDENGNPVEDAEIEIIQEGGNSEINPITDYRTNSNGEVVFEITAESAGQIEYRAFLSDYEIGSGVSVEFQPFLDKAQIGNNFPNPFSQYTRIPLTIPRQMDVHLSVISILGKNVQTILNESRDSGYYEIEFNPSGLASGVYFIRLVTEDGVSLNKMTFAK
jgi:hypothetical protein